MFGIQRRNSSPILLTEVSLGQKNISIPVARLDGKNAGKTLLITAGNDGDEYAGIEASYRIIEEFSHTQFNGRLIVIPIVNIPGFEAETSINPLDGAYPKHIFPGAPAGTPSERLRYWLSGITRQSDVWMDLHGGSLTETVNPYVHAWRSPHAETDAMMWSLIADLDVRQAVFQTQPDRVRKPAKNDCGYLMCESGSSAQSDDVSVNRHVSWVKTVMRGLRMVPGKNETVPKQVYTDVSEYTVTFGGIWRSDFPTDCRISKGSVIGTVRSLDGMVIEKIVARSDGNLLWGKVGMRARAGDVIAGIGTGSYSP